MEDERSFIPQFLKSANMLYGFEHRITYIDINNDEKKRIEVLSNVLKGTHVLITEYFEGDLCETNSNANFTLANLDNFRKSR